MRAGKPTWVFNSHQTRSVSTGSSSNIGLRVEGRTSRAIRAPGAQRGLVGKSKRGRGMAGRRCMAGMVSFEVVRGDSEGRGTVGGRREGGSTVVRIHKGIGSSDSGAHLLSTWARCSREHTR